MNKIAGGEVIALYHKKAAKPHSVGLSADFPKNLLLPKNLAVTEPLEAVQVDSSPPQTAAAGASARKSAL